MNADECHYAVQKQTPVRARYAAGGLAFEGTAMAYSAGPMLCVMTPDGERKWWGAELVEPAPTLPDGEETVMAVAKAIRDERQRRWGSTHEGECIADARAALAAIAPLRPESGDR